MPPPCGGGGAEGAVPGGSLYSFNTVQKWRRVNTETNDSANTGYLYLHVSVSFAITLSASIITTIPDPTIID
ncbi:hypothetical protein IGI04_004263 [Brassica rapa subsp. trilocularis]|uniref:PGG domain-containing protein n=1 Tax=Brassica rapa subsp. trilocularis TaxID=1813537 RepID=A0ABQ7NAM9_BRACM|nr:hypothetical protein IGI04_004263 [Brassica rapa subsp. trilocularis]